MKQHLKYNCVFGGGGVRGLAYVGAIKALREFNIEISSIAGASVGAVFASLFSVGYSEDEIKELFFDFNLNMFRDINIDFFNHDISFSKGEIFLSWLREKIGKKVFGEDYSNQTVTFKDIEKDLNILTVDLSSNLPFIFSKKTTPDDEIALAVRASAAMPGLMKPLNYGNFSLVDGDLIKSWPAWKIYENFRNDDSRILEFRLEGSKDGKSIKNPFDYLNSIISLIWYFSTENVYIDNCDNDMYDYVVIDTKDVIQFDFNINADLKQEIINLGYTTTKKYFSQTLLKKKQKLVELYGKIKKETIEINKFINRNKPAEVLFAVNELLAFICENKRYIDDYTYNKFKKLKNLVKENIRQQFIFGRTLINTKQLSEYGLSIENILEEKISEFNMYIFGNKS